MSLALLFLLKSQLSTKKIHEYTVVARSKKAWVIIIQVCWRLEVIQNSRSVYTIQRQDVRCYYSIITPLILSHPLIVSLLFPLPPSHLSFPNPLTCSLLHGSASCSLCLGWWYFWSDPVSGVAVVPPYPPCLVAQKSWLQRTIMKMTIVKLTTIRNRSRLFRGYYTFIDSSPHEPNFLYVLNFAHTGHVCILFFCCF